MEDCIFCKIVKKQIPSDIVYEDSDVLAFRDINPQVKEHVLIISKDHYKDIVSVDKEAKSLYGSLFNAAKAVAKKLGVSSSGYRLSTNIGDDAGQTVPHLHIHLLAGQKLSDKMG